MHLAYAKYLAKHKWFVFVAGLRLRAPLWRLIIHDWSKFLPNEWIPYATSFYGPQPRTDETKRSFKFAWLHHIHFNKHHWQYWVLFNDDGTSAALKMPEQYVREMVADWCGAGKAITGKWEIWSWYNQNAEKIQLHPDTRKQVEWLVEAFQCKLQVRSLKSW